MRTTKGMTVMLIGLLLAVAGYAVTYALYWAGFVLAATGCALGVAGVVAHRLECRRRPTE
jgi:hypothetical protein